MKIRIKAFASVKDVVGFDNKEMIVSDDISVSEVMQMLLKSYPGLEDIHTSLMYARNEEYCDGKEILRDDDTLAIFPHVSGG